MHPCHTQVVWYIASNVFVEQFIIRRMGQLLLVVVLFLPLIVSIVLLFIRAERVLVHRWVALGATLVTFFVSLPLFWLVDHTRSNFQLVTSLTWIPSLDAGFRIGLDGMSLLLVLLTTFTMPIAIGASMGVVTKREKEYYVMMLLLETAMVGVFIALDMFLFYVFWELILIPMYFIIGIWGAGSDLCGRQVLPVHHRWLAVDAGCHHMAWNLCAIGDGSFYERFSQASRDSTSNSTGHTAMAVCCLCLIVCY